MSMCVCEECCGSFDSDFHGEGLTEFKCCCPACNEG